MLRILFIVCVSFLAVTSGPAQGPDQVSSSNVADVVIHSPSELTGYWSVTVREIVKRDDNDRRRYSPGGFAAFKSSLRDEWNSGLMSLHSANVPTSVRFKLSDVGSELQIALVDGAREETLSGICDVSADGRQVTLILTKNSEFPRKHAPHLFRPIAVEMTRLTAREEATDQSVAPEPRAARVLRSTSFPAAR